MISSYIMKIRVYGFSLFLAVVLLGGPNSSNIYALTIQTEQTEEVQEDEFTDFEAATDTIAADSTPSCYQTCTARTCEKVEESSTISNSTLWVIAILLLTVVAGVLVRFKKARSFRILFLLASVVFFGVYRDACPCMISSFENFVLAATGGSIEWTVLIWFVGLIPITYIFGRVFCGWVCHLGAIQELLYRPGRFSLFTSNRARKVLKLTQYLLFTALAIQLVVQQKIFWCRIDPFLSIYQLTLPIKYEVLGGLLVGLLLVTSLLSFRPFCRAACPVGLVLGWIEKIPGAAVIGLSNNSCLNCNTCAKACKISAIHREHKLTTINNEECIMCGECFDACTQSGLKVFRASAKHKSKFKCAENSCNCK